MLTEIPRNLAPPRAAPERWPGVLKIRYFQYFLLMAGLGPTVVASGAESTPLVDCLLEQIEQPVNDTRTVADLKRYCLAVINETEVAESIQIDAPEPGNEQESASFLPFFEPYKESYLLAGAMRGRNGIRPFSGNNWDVKFRLGMKFQLFPDQPAFEKLAPLYVGYSQESWWDVGEDSGPFRENNYNPEVFWDYSKTSNRNGLNFIGRVLDKVGYEHQSNGEDDLQSRSWDRLYVQRDFQFSDRFSLGVKAWHVFYEDETNADITDFLGNVQLESSYRASDRLTLKLQAAQGSDTSKISYRLNLFYQVPEWVNSQFMLSYYEGYGEGLISYNQKTSSLRAGLFFPISFDTLLNPN